MRTADDIDERDVPDIDPDPRAYALDNVSLNADGYPVVRIPGDAIPLIIMARYAALNGARRPRREERAP